MKENKKIGKREKYFDPSKQKKRPKKKIRIVDGKISITKSGAGFVTPEVSDTANEKDNKSNDIFIAARNLKSAMNGDLVSVEIISNASSARGPGGRVKNVISRAVTSAVGVYTDCGRFGVVTPLGKSSDDIFVPRKNRANAKQGDMVEIKITKYPKGHKGPEGIISRIVASANDPHSEVKAILKENEVDIEFSMAAISEAKNACRNGDLNEDVFQEELSKRKDMRDLDIITIDGPHSKDLRFQSKRMRRATIFWEYILLMSVIMSKKIQPLIMKVLTGEIASIFWITWFQCFPRSFRMGYAA